jgi:hypothetical protein
MAVMTAEKAVSAADFLSPSTIPHYEPGPKTTRTVKLRGLWWVVTYTAELEEQTGGYLVKSCQCRPAEASEIAKAEAAAQAAAVN